MVLMVQFVQRVLVMFMPAKYQPDYMFLRNVPMRRVHLFTVIQLVCLTVLCIIKELGIVSIVFPVMVSNLQCRCPRGKSLFFNLQVLVLMLIELFII